MKIPKTLNILGLKYKIKFANNIRKEKIVNKEDKKLDLAGYCSSSDNLILINKNISKQTQFSIFIHEVLEAIDKHLALNLKHDDIDRLEAAIYQVIVENRAFKK